MHISPTHGEFRPRVMDRMLSMVVSEVVVFDIAMLVSSRRAFHRVRRENG